MNRHNVECVARASSPASSSGVSPPGGPLLKKPYVVVLMAWALLVLGVWWGLGVRERETMFEGKPLSQWLDAGFEDASRVLHEVGPPAAESIFTKLKREHPKYGPRARYRVVWNRLPSVCKRVLPQPKSAAFDEWRACHALLAIGRPVIPLLEKKTHDSNPLVRNTSVQALACFPRKP